MKALFEQSPFPPLRLTPGEAQRFERLATELLHKALADYERFGPPQHRQLNKTAWKAVKSHENCTVYLDRLQAKKAKSSKDKDTGNANISSGPSPFDPCNVLNHHALASLPLSFSSSSESADESADATAVNWRNTPELVLSGAVPGTLDDVMYGMSACDSADLMLRTAYVDDHLLDGAVLHQIKMPTPVSPFRFLGLKWSVKEIPGQYKKLLWPRDFVYLEASGVTTRPNGTRIGYLLRHPVDLAACSELSHRGVVRGHLAMSAIYTPLSNNTVDIFARGRIDLSGKGSHSLALTMSATALLSCSSAVFCAHNKKLVWLLREQQRNGGANPAIPVTRSNMFACGMCAKKFGKLSSVGTCRVCCVQMCSRCRMNRSLSFVNEEKDLQVEQIGGVFCKNCIAHANQSNAFQVASDEVRCGRYGSVHQHVEEEQEHTQEEDVYEPQTATTTATRNHMRSAPVGWTAGVDLHGHHPNHSHRHHSPQEPLQQPRLVPPVPVRTAHTASQRSLKPDVYSLSSLSISSSAPTISFDSNTSSSADLSRDSNGSRSSFGSDCYEHEEVSGDEIGVSSEFQEWTTPSQSLQQGELAQPVHKQYQYQYHQQQQQAQQQQVQGGVDANQQRQELWRKMTELRLQAESVYQLTKKNSSMHLSSSKIEACYDSDVEDLD